MSFPTESYGFALLATLSMASCYRAEIDISVLGSDPASDVAVLKISAVARVPTIARVLVAHLPAPGQMNQPAARAANVSTPSTTRNSAVGCTCPAKHSAVFRIRTASTVARWAAASCATT